MTPRLSVNEITSDQLDALYERAIQYRAAWHSARRRARGRTQAEAALDRVRAVHTRITNVRVDVCTQCSARDYPGYAVAWPCSTITVINGPKEN